MKKKFIAFVVGVTAVAGGVAYVVHKYGPKEKTYADIKRSGMKLGEDLMEFGAAATASLKETVESVKRCIAESEERAYEEAVAEAKAYEEHRTQEPQTEAKPKRTFKQEPVRTAQSEEPDPKTESGRFLVTGDSALN